MDSHIKYRLLAVISVMFIFSEVPVVHSEDCVILLHGLARSSSSMNKMEKSLSNSGYFTVNFDYPSTDYPIEELSKMVIESSVEKCQEKKIIHFVTHSLGGILVRFYLMEHDLEGLGRIVMLGPPNKGSQVVDTISWVPGFSLLNGPAGLQLGTGENSVPNLLGPAHFEVGIIAGTRSINLILSTMLPNPDDGKVSVDFTKLEGMADHISLPVSHPFIMGNDEVILQTIYFLKNGRFKKPEGR